MKPTLFLISLLVLLIPLGANAMVFRCDLALNLNSDTNSTEIKRLIFDINLADSENLMEGVLKNTSCFNNTSEPFVSNSSKLQFEAPADNTSQGTLENKDLLIGKNRYQLNLAFTQDSAPLEALIGSFTVNGKIESLDNKYFIHKTVEGKCQLSEE